MAITKKRNYARMKAGTRKKSFRKNSRKNISRKNSIKNISRKNYRKKSKYLRRNVRGGSLGAIGRIVEIDPTTKKESTVIDGVEIPKVLPKVLSKYEVVHPHDVTWKPPLAEYFKYYHGEKSKTATETIMNSDENKNHHNAYLLRYSTEITALVLSYKTEQSGNKIKHIIVANNKSAVTTQLNSIYGENHNAYGIPSIMQPQKEVSWEQLITP